MVFTAMSTAARIRSGNANGAALLERMISVMTNAKRHTMIEKALDDSLRSWLAAWGLPMDKYKGFISISTSKTYAHFIYSYGPSLVHKISGYVSFKIVNGTVIPEMPSSTVLL